MHTNYRNRINTYQIIGSFFRKGENQSTHKKLFEANYRTNKVNPHRTPNLGIKPGPHRWKMSTLTTEPSLLQMIQGECLLTSRATLLNTCPKFCTWSCTIFSASGWWGICTGTSPVLLSLPTSNRTVRPRTPGRPTSVWEFKKTKLLIN